ncbi:hypothetical protein SteCoe_2861 [Stentor coeruleus]|uniref:Protein kinase domain-containing protein n=1 Tax=Stentor coeruleus TaxID=5963 RepID=A0A1R2CYK2_9CILI|nr:hypothetical protein SteCoe_2861 [Stentor coeruleus]
MLLTMTTPQRSPVSTARRHSSSRPIRKTLKQGNSQIPELKFDLLSARASRKFSSAFKSYRVTNRNSSAQKSIREHNICVHTKFDDPIKEFESLDLPVSSDVALELFSRYFSEYEKAEVVEIAKVYYLSFNVPRLLIKEGIGQNFDDDLGNYNLIQGDAIAYRFEILEILGRGSFSQVVKCLDYKKNEIVAVKIIKNKKKFNAQAAIEIRLLENINNKDLDDSSNCIHLKEYFTFRGHICLVFEVLSMNLYELLKENSFKGMSTLLIRKIAIQVLQCLKFLKSIHIIHCDLKPENILLRNSESSSIKVIDFGSSCYDHERIYSYIQSRFYRAPEILLGVPYTNTIDMWSLGCILAELYTATPLFPANNEVELMTMILEINDVPSLDLLSRSLRKKFFFDRENRPRLTMDSRGRIVRPNTKKLDEVLKCTDAKFVEFIQKCLEWDPKKRMTPEEALRHDWIMEAQQKNVKKLKVVRDMYQE